MFHAFEEFREYPLRAPESHSISLEKNEEQAMYLIICFGYFIRHMVCKYFPCSVGCLLILLIVSFNAQKYTFIYFFLLLLMLLVSYQRINYWSTPMLPSNGLMVSVIIFRLLIHLVLIIVCGMKRPTSFFQMWKFNCSDIIYWKVYSSHIEKSWHLV